MIRSISSRSNSDAPLSFRSNVDLTNFALSQNSPIVIPFSTILPFRTFARILSPPYVVL